MKMFYGKTPVKSLNIKHYELSTNDATLKPSDMQSGVTAYAKGKKVTGTGKSFEFATYGKMKTNQVQYVPSSINVIEIASLEYPVQLSIALSDMENVDFSIEQIVGNIIVDNMGYELKVQAINNFLTVSCDKTVNLQVFYGKDNYV